MREAHGQISAPVQNSLMAIVPPIPLSYSCSSAAPPIFIGAVPARSRGSSWNHLVMAATSALLGITGKVPAAVRIKLKREIVGS
jgi:hypothetical protein